MKDIELITRPLIKMLGATKTMIEIGDTETAIQFINDTIKIIEDIVA